MRVTLLADVSLLVTKLKAHISYCCSNTAYYEHEYSNAHTKLKRRNSTRNCNINNHQQENIM